MYNRREEIIFPCVGKQDGRTESWKGSLRILKAGDPCEAEVEARGSYFHLIVGKHSYGNFVCIPNWNIGTELADLDDIFWNEERLRDYTSLRTVDACSVAAALNSLARHMDGKNKRRAVWMGMKPAEMAVSRCGTCREETLAEKEIPIPKERENNIRQ